MIGMVGAVIGSAIKFKKPALLLLLFVPIALGVAASVMHGRGSGGASSSEK
jgi:hypothetical protein